MKKNKKLIQTIFQFTFIGIFIYLLSIGKLRIWLLLFGVSLALTPIFGRVYCGYLCPMNTGMKWADAIAKKLHLRSSKIPKILTGYMLPWFVLLISVATMVGFRKILHKDFPVLVVLILTSMVLTLRYERWVIHNHFCPFGALLRVVGKKSFLRTQVDRSECVACRMCEKVCSSQAINILEDAKKAEINVSLCHQCQLCIDVCPKDAIHYERKNRSRNLVR